MYCSIQLRRLCGDYSYLNTDKSLQSKENRTKLADSSEACSKPRAFDCKHCVKMCSVTLGLKYLGSKHATWLTGRWHTFMWSGDDLIKRIYCARLLNFNIICLLYS